MDEGDSRFPHVYTRHSVEPGTASCIFPCVDDPGGRCTWILRIKCPRTLGDALEQPLASHQQAAVGGPARDRSGGRDLILSEEDKLLDMTVVCSGNLAGEEIDELDETKKIMTFEINDHPAAAQHVGFAVGPFEHVDLWSEFRSEEADEKLGASALKIHGYCLPGRQDEVRNSCEALAQAADEFAMTYGKYPYDSFKMCFVEDMIPAAVPLLGFALCSNRLLFPEDIIDPELDVTRILVHSLACQYFGVYIVPNQRTESWLTVGIAYYMTDLYLAKLCGNNDYRFRMKTMADRLVQEDRRRPSLHDLGNYLHLGDFEMDFMALKAPMVLFILDKRLSKAAGSAGANLARVISKIIGKANTSGWGVTLNEVISSESFIKVCEKMSQYRLEAFWSQWVYGSGCPSLLVQQRFNKKQLCVDLTIHQKQLADAGKAEPIQKSEFWRELVEEVHHVYAGEIQSLFTGPMTIRIHEANGTPYEHTVEIREDAGKGVKFHIPYNTKYRRLKRNRRQKEKAANAAAALDPGQDHNEEAIFFSLGDRLDSREDMEAWDLVDWTDDIERKMDQESYEWIRIDSDFEWIFKVDTNLPSYMYTSQLQQDRDVVAQQDSLLYLSRVKAHAMCATVLTRTLYDDRYYHGLRTLAAGVLSRQNLKPEEAADYGDSAEVIYRGMGQLMRVFQECFCYPGSQTPRPNDFSDKRQYMVQCAIPSAIADCQHHEKHPIEAAKFLLEQLRFNNNSSNPYSDHFYVAKLLDALATSLTSTASVPKKPEMSFTFDVGDGDDDDDVDEDVTDKEARDLLEQALAEIERYRRMDELTGSYQNIWTTTALDCYRKLMSAGAIPVSAIEFVQYLQDGTLDVVQIKAFEALVDLGLMPKPPILRLLLSTMATHPSPFMRDRLFKLFCQGLAGIAFGEHKEPAEQQVEVREENGLIIEQSDAVITKNLAERARREDVGAAMRELRSALKDNADFKAAMWDALHSRVTGCAEKRNLLDVFEVLFEGDESLLLTVRHPTMIVATTEKSLQPPSLMLRCKTVLRPLRPAEEQLTVLPLLPVPEEPPPLPAPTTEKKAVQPRIKIQTSKSFNLGAGTPSTPAQPRPSVAPAGLSTSPVPSTPSVPAPVANSVAAQPASHRSSVERSYPAAAATPSRPGSAAVAPPAASPSKPTPPKLSLKRKRDDRTDRDTQSQRPSKLVLVRVRPGYHARLRPETCRMIESSLRQESSSKGTNKSIRMTGPGTQSAASSPRTLDGSPLPSTPASGSQFLAPPSSGGTSQAKQTKKPKQPKQPKGARKPLPSGAPTPVVATPPAVAPPATATPTARQPMKIKIVKRPS